MIPILEHERAQEWIDQDLSSESQVDSIVKDILGQVRREGDVALSQLAQKFGDPTPRIVPQAERESLAASLDKDILAVIERAAHNIQSFAEAVMKSVVPTEIETPEFRAGLDMRPVARVACYAPGGRHPLPSTVLMTGLSARAAGVELIDLVCPSPHPAIMAAASMVGARRVYQMGGAQAVAALAYGTDTVEPVDMVVGPGNAFVTEAKRQLMGVIGIDMLAGPSEVAILADGGANPHWVALDLLAQAEHDPDARVALVTWDKNLAVQVQEQLTDLAQTDTYPDFLAESLPKCALLVVPSREAALQATDRLASEHLHLAVADPEDCKAQLQHYGGLFMGYHSTVPFGDYMAGPNHTLPTGRSARFSGGLSPFTFLRPQGWLHTGPKLEQTASNTAAFATLEGLHGHAAAARARLEKRGKQV